MTARRPIPASAPAPAPATPQALAPSVARARFGARLLRLGWLLAAVVGAGLYLPSLTHEFVFDDELLIVQNDRIRHLNQPAEWLFTSWWNRDHLDSEYRPVTMASFALNFAAGGTEPWSYHLANLLLHGAACAMVWLLARRMFGDAALALGAALVFAAHPAHVEAVSGVVGRAELLMTIFFIMAMLAALRSLKARTAAGLWGWAGAVFAASLVSVGAKEHGVMLAAVLGLFWFVPMAGAEPAGAPPRSARRLWRLAPSIGAATLAAGLYFIARRVVLGGFLRPAHSPIPKLDNPLAHLRGLTRVMTTLHVDWLYALRLAAPMQQSPDYSYNAIPAVTGIGDWRWVTGLAVAGLACAGLWGLRGRPAAWFGLTFTLVTFFVASNLVLPVGTIMAERLLYLPSAGFCVMAAAGAAGLGAARPRWRAAAWGALGLWGALLTAQQAYYLRVWRDEKSLFRYGVERAPESARMQGNYGNALALAGDFKEARQHLERSIAILDSQPRSLGMLGYCFSQLGDTKRAAEFYERSTGLDKGDPVIALMYANLLTVQGNKAKAERVLRDCARLNPRVWHTRYALGMWLAHEDRASEAIGQLWDLGEEVSDTERPFYLLQLANSYNIVGRHKDSIRLVEELLALYPDNVKAQMLLAANYAALGDKTKARVLLGVILKSNPDLASAKRLMEDLGTAQPEATGHELYK